MRRLAEALQSRGKDVWVDVEGIRDAEVFPDALRQAVESSDAFVFVISPDSVRSEFCTLEIEHATALNKQIVPLALRPVEDAEIPEEVRFRNWIPAVEDGDFGELVDRLVTALETDLDWEHQHSRVTAKALEWERSDRDRSFLLRGADLGAAESWLATGADKDPGPTALEREYLAAARAAATRRQRGVVVASLAVAAIAIALLVFALISRDDAIHARNGAKAQALTSDAERVGAQALVEKNLDRALLFAVAGVKLQNRAETRGDLLAMLEKNPAAIRLIRPSRNEITSLAVRPGGRLLATGDSAGIVRFEDIQRWRQSGSVLALTGAVAPRAMTFSPSGNALAVVSSEAARSNLYSIDVASRGVHRLGSWPGLVPIKPAGSASIAYSPDGKRIALSLATASSTALTPAAEKLLMLDAASGRPIWQRQYPMHPGQWEPHVEFLPNGALLTSAQQGDTLLWNARTGRVVRRFPLGGQPAISADGRSVALGQNSPSPAIPSASVALLDLHTGSHRSFPAAIPSAWITSLAFTPDRTSIVGATFDGDVHIWSIATGSIAETFSGPPGGRAEAVLDPSGHTVLTGSEDGSVLASDLLGTRRLGRSFRWNTPDASCGASPCIVVNPQSTLMATDQAGGSIALLDLRTLSLATTLPPRDGPTANALAFFPDGRTLVTGGVAGHLTLWDTRARSVRRTIPIGRPVWWVAVSPDGRLLAVQTQGQDETGSRVEVLSAATNKPLWSHDLQDGRGGLHFSPDGRLLAAVGCCTSRSTVATWDARSGVPLFVRRFAIHATAISYEPNARIIGVGTEDGQVLFWDSRTGTQKSPPLHVASGSIDQVSFSPDGTRMAAGSFDLSTTLWDLNTRKQVGNTFPEQLGAIPITAFEPNGRLLIDYLSNAAEWPLDVQTWERFACQVAGRDLSQAEWRDVLPQRPYMHVCS